MNKERFRQPGHKEQQMIESVEVELLGPNEADRLRYGDMMSTHHYLKSDRLVGEQLRYVAKIDGQWVALLSWSAAAKSLKEREKWLEMEMGEMEMGVSVHKRIDLEARIS